MWCSSAPARLPARAALSHSEARLGPGPCGQVSLHLRDVAELAGGEPRIGLKPAAEAVPCVARAVGRISPRAAETVWIVEVEAQRGSLVIGVEGRCLPTQRLRSRPDGAIWDPLDLADPHRLVDLVGIRNPGLRRVF